MAAKPQNKPSSRDLLIEAAEALMRENGYAAVTSRKVANKAGLKPQLVHYHFNSMDDLFVAVYRRFGEAMLAKQQDILAAKNPLREMWKVSAEARGQLLTEFIALANHRKVLQKEFAIIGQQFRHTQIEILTALFEQKGFQAFPWTPQFTALVLNSLSRGLAVESEFDITEGHAEAFEVVEHFLQQFD